jgi:translation initiation factor IF-3
LINDKIRVRELRLVGDNVEPGVYPIDKARQIAAEQELDLVVISDKAEPFIASIWTIKNSYTSKRKSRRN